MASLYRSFWIFLLTPIVPTSCNGDHVCQLVTNEVEGFSQPGDVLIGAVLPMRIADVYRNPTFTERPASTTCTMLPLSYFQHLQALLFAVEEINHNKQLLPNITLGVQWYDSCGVIPMNTAATLQVLSGQGLAIPNYRYLQDVPLGAVIGSSFSSHSISLANILGLYRYPQVSYYSTSSLLSDKIKFPSFFRTVPSDAFQSKGLAKLVFYFRWTWIGLLATDNDYGQQGIQVVKQEITKSGACIAFTENILTSRQDRNAPHIIKVIKESTAKIIVVFSSGVDLLPILDEMMKQNVKGVSFVASEGWSTTPLQQMKRFSSLLLGTIGLALYRGDIPGFREHLNKVRPNMRSGGNLVKTFWEEVFTCKFLNPNVSTNQGNVCTGVESLDSVQNSYNDVSNLRVTYNMYTAVYVVANALNDLREASKGKFPYCQKNCAHIWNFIPWQILQYMKKVRVKLSSGSDLYFDENGDPPAIYDIVNWQLGPTGAIQYVKVGSYNTEASPGQVFSINSSLLLWATEDKQVPVSVCSESCPRGFRKAPRRGQPICCFQCVPCPQGEISNQSNSVDCVKCPWNEWPNSQKTTCLEKLIEFLSYDELLGATLSSVSVLSFFISVFILSLFMQYKSTPVVKANNYSLSCLLLISLSLCFLCPLVFIGYPQHEKCLLRQAMFGLVFALCMSCILAKTIMVVIAFMATRPDSTLRRWTNPQVSYTIIFVGFVFQFLVCITWLSLAPPFPQNNIDSLPTLIVVECNEGSPIAFWTMLGYLFLLATISFIVAFLARRLPDSFNEAQFISFSMLAFLSVWVAFIPASLSAQGKYTVAMEIFAILASSWALVICMFLPKCFIILFKPNLNTRANIMGRDL